MTDSQLADLVIARLNALIADPDVRADVSRLITTHVTCTGTTLAHPTIQTTATTFGFLGLLNGLVGAIADGPKVGWGYIAALFDDHGNLIAFERTDE
jgi:hypothetical protein